MRADLPLPENSFVLDRLEIIYGDFDEVELGRQLCKAVFSERHHRHMMADLRNAHIVAYLYDNYEDGAARETIAAFWIVAHFKTDDEGVLFMLKHNIQPQRILRVDKMSSQWLRHKNKLDAFENPEYK